MIVHLVDQLEPVAEILGCGLVQADISDEGYLILSVAGNVGTGEVGDTTHPVIGQTSWLLRAVVECGDDAEWQRLLSTPLIELPFPTHPGAFCTLPACAALAVCASQLAGQALVQLPSLSLTQAAADTLQLVCANTVASPLVRAQSANAYSRLLSCQVPALMRMLCDAKQRSSSAPALIRLLVSAQPLRHHACTGGGQGPGSSATDTRSMLALLHRLGLLRPGPASRQGVLQALRMLLYHTEGPQHQAPAQLAAVAGAEAAGMQLRPQLWDTTTSAYCQQLAVAELVKTAAGAGVVPGQLVAISHELESAIQSELLHIYGMQLDALVAAAAADPPVTTHTGICGYCGCGHQLGKPLTSCNGCLHDFHVSCAQQQQQQQQHQLLLPSELLQQQQLGSSEGQCLSCQGFRPDEQQGLAETAAAVRAQHMTQQQWQLPPLPPPHQQQQCDTGEPAGRSPPSRNSTADVVLIIPSSQEDEREDDMLNSAATAAAAVVPAAEATALGIAAAALAAASTLPGMALPASPAALPFTAVLTGTACATVMEQPHAVSGAAAGGLLPKGVAGVNTEQAAAATAAAAAARQPQPADGAGSVASDMSGPPTKRQRAIGRSQQQQQHAATQNCCSTLTYDTPPAAGTVAAANTKLQDHQCSTRSATTAAAAAAAAADVLAHTPATGRVSFRHHGSPQGVGRQLIRSRSPAAAGGSAAANASAGAGGSCAAGASGATADGADGHTRSQPPQQKQQLSGQLVQQQQQQQLQDDQLSVDSAAAQIVQDSEQSASESDDDPSEHARKAWDTVELCMHNMSAGQRIPAVLPVLRLDARIKQRLLQRQLQELRTQPRKQELLCLWQKAYESGSLPPGVHQLLCSWLNPGNSLQWAGGVDQQPQSPAAAPEAAPLLALALLAMFVAGDDAIPKMYEVLLGPMPVTGGLGADWAEPSASDSAAAGVGASAAAGAASYWDLSAVTPDVVGRVVRLLQLQVTGWLAGTSTPDLLCLLRAYHYMFSSIAAQAGCGPEVGLVARRETLLQVIDAVCSVQPVADSVCVQGSTGAATVGPGPGAAGDLCGDDDITPAQCRRVWQDLLQAAPPLEERTQYQQAWWDFLQPAGPTATAGHTDKAAAQGAAAATAVEAAHNEQQQGSQHNSSSSSSISLGPQHLPLIIAAAEPDYGNGAHLCCQVNRQLLEAAVLQQHHPIQCFAGPDWPPSGRHLVSAWANVLAAGLSCHPQLSALQPLQQWCLEFLAFTQTAQRLHPAALNSSQVWAALCIGAHELEHSGSILRTLHASAKWCVGQLALHRDTSHPVCPGDALAGALAGELLLLWHQDAQLLALVAKPDGGMPEEQRATEPLAAVQIRSAAAAVLPGVLKGMLQQLLSSACRPHHQQQQQLPAHTSAGQASEGVVSCGRKLVSTWQAVYRLLLLPDAELAQAHAAVCLGGGCLRAFMQPSVDSFGAAVGSGQFTAAGSELDRLLEHLMRRPSPAAIHVNFSVPATQA